MPIPHGRPARLSRQCRERMADLHRLSLGRTDSLPFGPAGFRRVQLEGTPRDARGRSGARADRGTLPGDGRAGHRPRTVVHQSPGNGAVRRDGRNLRVQRGRAHGLRQPFQQRLARDRPVGPFAPFVGVIDHPLARPGSQPCRPSGITSLGECEAAPTRMAAAAIRGETASTRSATAIIAEFLSSVPGTGFPSTVSASRSRSTWPRRMRPAPRLDSCLWACSSRWLSARPSANGTPTAHVGWPGHNEHPSPNSPAARPSKKTPIANCEKPMCG